MMNQSTVNANDFLLVAVCLVIAAFAWGLGFYGFGFYVASLQTLHDWPVSLLSAAVATHSLLSGAAAVFVGKSLARHGAYPVMVFGILIYSLGLIGLAALQFIEGLMAKGLLFIPFILGGVGFAAISTASISAVLIRRFTTGLGLALGFALTGASIGGAVIPPFMVWLTEQYGFANTMIIMGLATSVVLFPLAYVFIRNSEPASNSNNAGSAQGDTLESSVTFIDLLAIPHYRYIGIAAAFALAAQVTLFMHMVPSLQHSIGMSSATLAVSTAAGAGIIGRFLIAYLSIRWSLHYLAASCYLVQAFGIVLIILLWDTRLVFIGTAMTGLVVGAIVMITPMLLNQIFNKTDYSIAYGWIAAAMQAAVFITSITVGLLKDVTGSYLTPFMFLILLHSLAILAVLMGRRISSQTSGPPSEGQ